MRTPLAITTLSGVWLAAWVTTFVACSAFESDDPIKVAVDGGRIEADAAPGNADAEPTGECEPACGPAQVCLAGKCELGCPDKIVYVSSGGADTNTGCSKSAPKRTIASAIAIIKTSKLALHEIHVCKGSYSENLVLDEPIPLRGGYECALWTRVDKFGFTGFNAAGRANPFDNTNESIIVSAGNASVLEISGESITSAVAIEGFTFRANTTDSGGVAIRVSDRASPVIAHNVIIGGGLGSPPNPTIASRGIDVLGGAAPEIRENMINGGSGGAGAAATARYGSVGVHLHTAGAPRLHDNEINAGTGIGMTSSTVGVLVEQPTLLANESAIFHNTVLYGGKGGIPKEAASYGIGVGAQAQADVVENTLLGQRAECFDTTNGCLMFGVVINGSTPGGTPRARVLRNRIYSGEGNTLPRRPFLYGIYMGQPASRVDVFNNLIDTGSKGSGAGIAGVIAGGDRRISHNTMRSATGEVAGVLSYGPETTIDNNLFVGVPVGIQTGSCTFDVGAGAAGIQVPPVEARSNAFIGVPVLARRNIGACTAALETTSLANETTAITNMSRSVTVQKELCETAAQIADRCRQCTNPNVDACTNDVFGVTPFPRSLNEGWKPKNNVWCGIANSTHDESALIILDAAGVTRTAPSTIGALEQNACITQ